MNTFTVSQPAQLLTTSEAKLHAKVDYDADDAVIAACCMHAQSYVQGETGYLLGEQTVDCFFDSFDDFLQLDIGPIISIESVKYLDSAGTEKTLSPSAYRFLRGKSKIVPVYGGIWPTVLPVEECITVRVKAGWKRNADYEAGETELPPELFKLLCLLTNHYYEYRELVYTGMQLREFPEHLTAKAICAHHMRVNI